MDTRYDSKWRNKIIGEYTMITDKQFDDAFTAAGGWFILTQFEEVYNWKYGKEELIDKMYAKGFDKSKSGTRTRVSSLLRIIENKRSKDAFVKIRDSRAINRVHPEAFEMAKLLIEKYC